MASWELLTHWDSQAHCWIRASHLSVQLTALSSLIVSKTRQILYVICWRNFACSVKTIITIFLKIYIYTHPHAPIIKTILLFQKHFSGPTTSEVSVYQDQGYWGLTLRLVLERDIQVTGPLFTIILDNKIEANTSDGTRRTTFPLLISILSQISIMLATEACRIHMLLAAASVNKQSQNCMFPWSQQPSFHSCAKCLGFLRTPWRWVALLSLPDRMESSPLPTRFATRPANNHLPYEAILPLADQKFLSADQC